MYNPSGAIMTRPNSEDSSLTPHTAAQIAKLLNKANARPGETAIAIRAMIQGAKSNAMECGL